MDRILVWCIVNCSLEVGGLGEHFIGDILGLLKYEKEAAQSSPALSNSFPVHYLNRDGT
jgi:hypothetical protein